MKKLKYKDVQEYIEKFGYELLENEYVDNKTNMKIRDSDGYFYSVRFGNFKDYMEISHKKFDIVNNFNPYSIDNINNFIKINGYNSYVVDNDYNKGKKYKLTLRCSCGNIFKASWDKIRNRNKMICPECMKNRESHNERKVKKYLMENNIDYIQESRINIKDNVHLILDFYIPSLNIAIEVNGEQHYKPVRFGGISKEKAIEKFNKQIKRDADKRHYCLNNNIYLIEIPYWDFTNNKYIERLNNTINKK